MSSSKETIMQSGEGGFLRGFVDYLFHELQEKGLYDDRVVVTQSIRKGVCQMLAGQNCEYNSSLRGIDNGQVVNKHTHMIPISQALNPYAQYEEYMGLVKNPGLHVIVSNTTEAGIEYLGTERLTDTPPKSYPAKLTQFLYEKLQPGLKGFTPLPCGPIDSNTNSLKKCILQHADSWGLDDSSRNQLESENDFCNTLVDRIVTGYPKDEVEKLAKQTGYTDNPIDTVEVLHLWIIEDHREDELPFNKAGYNIVWTDDAKPYKKRKIRILNGGHTSTILGTCPHGLSIVGECLRDETASASLKKCIFEEVVPTLGNIEADVKLGKAVLERFSSLSIKHQLLSIALNSVSKSQARVLPAILEYKEKFGKYPAVPIFSMVALIASYRTDEVNGGANITEFMKTASVEDIVKREDYQHSDLTGMIPLVTGYYSMIQEEGVAKAYEVILT